MQSKRGIVVLVAVGLLAANGAWAGNGISAEDAFARLKSLEGTWVGTRTGEGEEAQAEAERDPGARHEFRVSAAGTVVMETMFPGTEHEMINMYHIDGEELMLTHYCSAGNQPTMRLDRAASSPDLLVFEFSGGTNLDPSKDTHIHAAKLTLGDRRMTSEWTSWIDGKAGEAMSFHLARE